MKERSRRAAHGLQVQFASDAEIAQTNLIFSRIGRIQSERVRRRMCMEKNIRSRLVD